MISFIVGKVTEFAVEKILECVFSDAKESEDSEPDETTTMGLNQVNYYTEQNPNAWPWPRSK